MLSQLSYPCDALSGFIVGHWHFESLPGDLDSNLTSCYVKSE